MAKGKKPSAPAPDEGGPSKPISYRPSKAVAAALEDYRGNFEFKPDRSAILERALRRFLREKGYDLPDVESDD